MSPRSNAQTARKGRFALPAEFSLEQQVLLIQEFVSELTSMGMIIDANIHHDKEHNPHVHLMMTTRELAKNRYGEIIFSPRKNRDWGSKAFIIWTRMRFAELQNEHLAKHGFDCRVTEKSYKDLGLDKIRAMFGGFGLYYNEVMFALIAYNELYFKADSKSAAFFKESGSEPFTYENKGRSIKMSYWKVPPEVL